VRAILGDLEAGGIVSVRGADRRDAYQLGRAADAISIAQVLEALRGRSMPAGRESPPDPSVRALVAELERGIEKALDERTLADLTGAVPPADAAR